MGGVEDFIATTGVRQKRKAPDDVCSSDLCAAAAERLIKDLNWDKAEIEALVLVTQSPDYRIPATSCMLQDRLGLPQSCLALDVSLGCSGWVYGLSVIASMMKGGGVKKGLLLAGDTSLKMHSENDKSGYPLFGDAGSCTALEFTGSDNDRITFRLYTDGSGYRAIIMPEGGYRVPATPDSFRERVWEDGSVRSPLNVAMDGMEVFSFGITKAPKVIKELLADMGEDVSEIDVAALHQANLLMNEKIRKKLKMTPEQVPYSLDEFGNTSCVSIPLTLVVRSADMLRSGRRKVLACGFGVGLSWGAARFDTDGIAVPPLIEI